MAAGFADDFVHVLAKEVVGDQTVLPRQKIVKPLVTLFRFFLNKNYILLHGFVTVVV
jgi:hypothetical protein